jgi:amidase
MQSATQIAADVRAGRRRPQDSVQESLDRIATADPTIGAFQVVDAEGARRAAQELAARPDLADLPLAGVPVAIKDNVDVAGMPTRHGSGATSAEPAAADDPLVRRLREAGAIVVGKTKMPELAIWGFTESIALGGTRNPRNPARNAGGSTGGGSAAVAAGMVPIALGSDGGGSLRIPPANCGVVGLKPARGTAPLPGGIDDHWYGMSVVGPVANTVADAALFLDVLAGSSAWRGGDEVPETLRVAVSSRSPSPIGPAGRTARVALKAAADAAARAGHRVSRASPPYPALLAMVFNRHWLGGIALEVELLGLDPQRLEPRTQRMVRSGQRLRRRGEPTGTPARQWQASAELWFSTVDVLITPVISAPAPPMGWATRQGFLRSYLNGARTVPFTQAWNLAGFPAMSLPFGGTTTEPGAVQLIALPGREARLLHLAEQLERVSTRDS